VTNTFKDIQANAIADNIFNLVGKDWMLITAGTSQACNTMTASWGGFGVLWNKHICWCVIRPQRFTYQFMEKAARFTLSFFDEKYRDALTLCGTKSGRDCDKVAQAGLTPRETRSGSVFFDQARLVIECRKIYFQDLDPDNFLDPKIHDEYPDRDYHRMYLGEIERCLAR